MILIRTTQRYKEKIRPQNRTRGISKFPRQIPRLLCNSIKISKERQKEYLLKTLIINKLNKHLNLFNFTRLYLLCAYQAHEDDCQVVDIQPLGILFCVVCRGFDVLLCIVCAGLSGVLERFALRIIKFLFFHFLYIAIS